MRTSNKVKRLGGSVLVHQPLCSTFWIASPKAKHPNPALTPRLFCKKRYKAALPPLKAVNISAAPTTVDLPTARHQSLTTTVEAAQEKMQAAERMPTPSKMQILERETYEMYQVSKKVSCLKKCGDGEKLFQEMTLVAACLEEALLNLHDFQMSAGDVEKTEEE